MASMTAIPLAPIHPSILSEPEWAQAFRQWWKAQKFTADVETIIRQGNPQAGTWRVFLRSAEAQLAMSHAGNNGVAHPDAAADGFASHPAKAQWLAGANGQADHGISGFPKPAPPAGSSQPLPRAQTPSGPAATTNTEDSTRQRQPSANPLIALIADGLREIGFAPERAITAEQAQSIAAEAALSIAERVTAQLQADLQSGKYQQKQTIDIRVNGQHTATIDGTAPVWFPRMLKLAQCRIPALLVGPAGCGKTTGAHLLAQALGLPFYRVSLSAGVDEGVLQGWLLPVETGGRFCYVPSTLVTAYERGGVVLLDEIDSADANMLIILNAVLDNGQWHVPIRHECPILTRHPDFVVVAAANTWGHGADRRFVGSNQLDERTLSRFRMGQIACDYDADLERQLYDTKMVTFGHELRQRCRALPGWTRDVSTRDIESAHTKLAAFTPAEAWYEYFADWADEETMRARVTCNHTTGTATMAA